MLDEINQIMRVKLVRITPQTVITNNMLSIIKVKSEWLAASASIKVGSVVLVNFLLTLAYILQKPSANGE